MIKAIIFDLGGVVIENPWPGMLRHYAAYFEISEDVFARAHKEYEIELQKGNLTEDAYWKLISQATGSTKQAIENLWIQGLLTAYQDRPQVRALMEWLKAQGYIVALLSNTETAVMEYLNFNPIPHIDVAMYSCVMGMVKPNADIYLAACARLGVQPEETVFIDDREENVLGARQVGMAGIVYTTFEEVEEQLAAILNRA